MPMPVAALLLPLLLAQSAIDGLPPGVGAMREGSIPRRKARYVPKTGAASSRLDACLDAAAQDPDAALDTANAWLREARGSSQAEPRMCLGWAYSTQQAWGEATRDFVAGRDVAATSDHLLRARLGAMAGNAAWAALAPRKACRCWISRMATHWQRVMCNWPAISRSTARGCWSR